MVSGGSPWVASHFVPKKIAVLFLRSLFELTQCLLHCSPPPKCCSLTPDFPPLITLCNKLPFGLACGEILWKWTVAASEMLIHLYLA